MSTNVTSQNVALGVGSGLVVGGFATGIAGVVRSTNASEHTRVGSFLTEAGDEVIAKGALSAETLSKAVLDFGPDGPVASKMHAASTNGRAALNLAGDGARELQLANKLNGSAMLRIAAAAVAVTAGIFTLAAFGRGADPAAKQ
ncbi:MAG: hypothetical protein JWO69_1163 [Thermoleophilia bacterium]|jgi:hypothetical protein|nr:hypothetical protein [Thermoleophilia bacterium]